MYRLLSGGNRPKLLEPFRDVTATAPKEAVFQCRIDLGQPAAKVRCYRDGRELTESSKYSTVVRGDEIRLVVRDTELADEAKYRCEASNRLGTVDTEARLTMKSTLRNISIINLSVIFVVCDRFVDVLALKLQSDSCKHLSYLGLITVIQCWQLYRKQLSDHCNTYKTQQQDSSSA